MDKLRNPILNADTYKESHYCQYPENTEKVFSYIESRGCELGWKELVFFGLQMFLKEYLARPITEADIDKAERVLAYHLEGVPRSFKWGSGTPPRLTEIFNRAGWEYILKEHGGWIPVRVKAPQEGLVIPLRNCLVTVENTDPKCFWATSFIESAILRGVWYPTTVATKSWRAKQIIKAALELSCDIPDIILPTRLHDFGARGVSSFESAGLGGVSHLVNFEGTDTLTALLFAEEYYSEEFAGISIAAAEHSTMTALREEGEVRQMERMIDKFARKGAFVAVVSDSYDIWRACRDYWGGKLKEKVIASGATIVVRPDSGDPVFVPIECIEILADAYGTTLNNKGFKVLNNVAVIQGDGTSEDNIKETLRILMEKGFSTQNIAFGMGGALLQRLDRDTLQWAMKNCWMNINGEGVDIFKRPITDPGKNSKRGRLTLVQDRRTGEYLTVNENQLIGNGNKWNEMLELVFENGKLIRDMTFEQVRANSVKLLAA